MKKTKIICTMGPSTDDAVLLAEMMRSGMDLARFNFSHGCHEDHARRVELVRKAAAEVEKPIALIADTKGPEMRLGIFKEGRVILKEGDSFTLTTEEIEGTQEISYVNYAGLPEELQPGNAILLSDGLLALEVTDVDVQGGKIYTKVVHGGEISSRKRVACHSENEHIEYRRAAGDDHAVAEELEDRRHIQCGFIAVKPEVRRQRNAVRQDLRIRLER